MASHRGDRRSWRPPVVPCHPVAPVEDEEQSEGRIVGKNRVLMLNAVFWNLCTSLEVSAV